MGQVMNNTPANYTVEGRALKSTLIRIFLLTQVCFLAGAYYGSDGQLLNNLWSMIIEEPDLVVEEEIVPIEHDPIDSIFIGLDVERVDVPVARAGSGGALASVDNDLLVMTHEGRFFDVTGAEAVELAVAPPPNGWGAMLAFEEANPNYNFAHYFFRYNDLDVFDDQLVVSYTEWVADDNCYRTSLAKAPLGGASTSAAMSVSKSDWDVFFSAEPCLEPKAAGRAIDGHMAGGRFRISADRTVYLASGDYAVDGTYSPLAIAQDPTQEYGKVLAIDFDTGEADVISQGHSNMQGITFTDDGSLYAVEHGRRGGDELNLIEAGNDYGWPRVSLSTRYNKLPLQNTLEYGRHPVFEAPVYSWLPSVAVSSLMRIENFHPAWDGDLLAGSLAEQTLFRIRLQDGRVLFDERIPVGYRIRYVHQHEDKIVLWTDEPAVLRLSVGAFDSSYQFAADMIGEFELTAEQKNQVEVALDQCSQCHGFGVLKGGNAPSLGEVYGREIAGLSDFAYSQSLSNVEGIWTRETLTEYLDDPDAFASGTAMPNPEISDLAVLSSIVEILVALREQAE